MKIKSQSAEIIVPDGTASGIAIGRTTHLAVGAHPDDVEIMAFAPIGNCWESSEDWFTGVIVTDGAGSPRSGAFAGTSDADMVRLRREEQIRAAELGRYGALVFLNYSSADVRDPQSDSVVSDLAAVLQAARPEHVYTHNFADKHSTHVALASRTIAALRRLPASERPKAVYGCEVWRDLDWLIDDDKVELDCSEREELQQALIDVFESQVAGGKNYVRAILGRRAAHATFHRPHDTDVAAGLNFAMDLTPLIRDDQLDIASFVGAHIDRFADDVRFRMREVL